MLDELSSAETVDGIIELLTKCKLGDYAAALKECNIDEEMESKLLAEAKLDGEYYKSLSDITESIKDGLILSKAFGIIVDMKNLQVILRAIVTETGSRVANYTISSGYMVSSDTIKDLLALKLNDVPSRLANTQYGNVVEEVVTSYDETKNIAVIDQVIEKHKFRLIEEMLSPRVLTPIMAAWYLILKEVEIQNLRLILKAMFDNISVEETRNYLVLPS
jgi:vacuolar-type H+-ATPase subunit C/Vma6